MRHYMFASLAALVLGVGPALAISAASDDVEAMDEVTRMDFICEDGPGFTAIFLNTAGGNSYATLSYENQPVWFEIAMSASGARYVSEPIDSGEDGVSTQLELWTKGKTATLSTIDGEDTQALFSNCTAE